MTRETAIANFRAAVSRVEPVAERVCREQDPRLDCDYLIRVDPDPRQPPNAFQTRNRAGRPVLVFTQGLIADARNQDEIAFVIGHEAAHHIALHIDQRMQSAAAGQVLGGLLGAAIGADANAVDSFSRLGASVGARVYSKEQELEADALGAVITARAGYDPVRGAAYFQRSPDPGNRFLGSHPGNAQRIAVVRQVAAGL
ncbi:M48 family metalloprotease [Jannaschia seohaensis]|uniref:M48 family metalloprotease n=1 Tax=Jannaschia seohaensis TaxID=475081 RepID=UPI00319DE21D